MRHRLPNGYDIQAEHIELVTTVTGNEKASMFRIFFASGHQETVTGTADEATAARKALVQVMSERD